MLCTHLLLQQKPVPLREQAGWGDGEWCCILCYCLSRRGGKSAGGTRPVSLAVGGQGETSVYVSVRNGNDAHACARCLCTYTASTSRGKAEVNQIPLRVYVLPHTCIDQV